MAHKVFGSSTGLTILAEDQATPANGMVNYITSSFQSGYQNGDIKGAFLSDTDDTDLVGSGELVTNGDFATGDLTGWADPDSGWSVSSNAAVMASTGDYKPLTQDLGLTAGVKYVITFDVTAISGTMKVALDSSSPGVSNTSVNTFTATGSYSFTVTPESGETYIIFARQASATSSVTIDNISVKLADADRSVNNNGLIVNGTVTRSAVATGAELVAYSGFSSSNYLEQPDASGMPTGATDTFHIQGWAIIPTSITTNQILVDFGTVATGQQRAVAVDGSGSGQLYLGINGSNTAGSSTVDWRVNGLWQKFDVVHDGANGVTIYRNGQLLYTNSALSLVSASGTPILEIGRNLVGSNAWTGSLALLRISATAPTAEQIKKIYEDEKVLFQENAACTLYGASDAVAALAHDSDTGLLHAGTSAGRSVFQGLRRVSNTTTAVGTAISASNGLIAEE